VGDRVTYVGHATVLADLAGTRVVTDPLLRERFIVARRHAPPPDPAVAERLDAVLISHLHGDHLDLPSLSRLPRETPVVIPVGGARLLARAGFAKVMEVASGDSLRIGSVDLTAIRAVHDGRRWKIGRRVEALGYVLRAPGASLYFAGDTDLFDEMEALEGIDVALLPIAGWGPRIGPGHLDATRAAKAAAMIRPRAVVPIHWGTYLRYGLERTQPELLTRPPRELAAELADRAPGVELQALEPGGSLALASLAAGSASTPDSAGSSS
jgi:L-ascorbate metabolism protein UlaG (beta-lactamase superfamily)